MCMFVCVYVCVCVCPVTQSYSTLCNPVDCSSTGSSIQETFHGKNTGVGCHFLLQGIYPRTLEWAATSFSRGSTQEHWSGLPLPSPGDLPKNTGVGSTQPGIRHGSLCLLPWQVDSLPLAPPESERLSFVSDSLWPRGLYNAWNSPGQNTGVGSLSLLQQIFPIQGIEPRSPALLVDSLPAEAPGKSLLRHENQISSF